MLNRTALFSDFGFEMQDLSDFEFPLWSVMCLSPHPARI